MTSPSNSEASGGNPQTTLVALRQRRERTISLLCEHFARDHLEADELEQLIDRAHAAKSLQELDGLLKDLPELSVAVAVPAEEQAVEPGAIHRSEHQPVIAVMGGVERKGRWTPARQLYSLAFMGGIVLDFRRANLPNGYTDVYTLAWMGGIEIIVPPGLQVVSDGVGIMGGFGHGGNEQETLDLTRPVLRIRGAAIMGGVEIRAAAPGDTAERLTSGESERSEAPRALGHRDRQRLRRAEREGKRQRDGDDRWLDGDA